MAGEPLLPLCKLNTRPVNEAWGELMTALAAEELAGHRAAEADKEVDREIERAARLTSTDADVEALGFRLPPARRRVAAARAAAESARAETDRCRALLAAVRAAAEIADSPLARHEAGGVPAAPAGQEFLDDVGRSARRP